jgi:hypothetical protein
MTPQVEMLTRIVSVGFLFLSAFLFTRGGDKRIDGVFTLAMAIFGLLVILVLR